MFVKFRVECGLGEVPPPPLDNIYCYILALGWRGSEL